MQFWIAEVTLHGIGNYTSSTAPSPDGEGWDEGKCKELILFSSPRPSPAGEGAQYICTLLFFIMMKSCVDTYVCMDNKKINRQ
jgi:hypothetical protein